jgi:hypothetical protein
MLKRQVEIGGEYAWREQYSFSPDEYRKVTLLKFLNKPGGRHALVRDKDGEFETHLELLIKPWSVLGPKDKESEFRTRAEKHEHERRLAQERDPVGFEIEESWRALSPFEPGKGGVPRVPEWLPRMFNDMASGVLKLDMGQYQVGRDEQMASDFGIITQLCRWVETESVLAPRPRKDPFNPHREVADKDESLPRYVTNPRPSLGTVVSSGISSDVIVAAKLSAWRLLS